MFADVTNFILTLPQFTIVNRSRGRTMQMAGNSAVAARNMGLIMSENKLGKLTEAAVDMILRASKYRDTRSVAGNS
jgi:hypothetical protein